jgi:L-threonylcarbamoyladenylate synthase
MGVWAVFAQNADIPEKNSSPLEEAGRGFSYLASAIQTTDATLDSNEIIRTAADVLRKGGIVLSPTDTVWSLLCDARNKEAVQRVHQLRNRETAKPLVVAVAEIGWMSELTGKVPEIAWDIVEFAERPLTVVFSNGRGVAPGVLAADGSVAVRLVKDDFAQRLVGRVNRAVVMTSAERPHQFRPRTFDDVNPEIRDGVDYIVPLEQNDRNHYHPADILRIEVNGEIKFIRK